MKHYPIIDKLNEAHRKDAYESICFLLRPYERDIMRLDREDLSDECLAVLNWINTPDYSREET